MAEYQLLERAPAIAEYQRIRRSVGWYELSDKTVKGGLAASLYAVCVAYRGEVIGCGRVIGDGGMYFYLQDIAVMPAHQGKGVGRMIMDAITAYLDAYAPKDAFIGLMAARGKASFYEKYGYRQREPGRPGMFRIAGG